LEIEQMALLLTIREVMAETGFGRSTIFEMIRRGELKAKHPSKRKTVVLRSELMRFIDEMPDRVTAGK
jgi:predicted DNA-binding transcriptional regulator AlpA